MSVSVPSWQEFQDLVMSVAALEDRVAELETYHEPAADNPPPVLVGASTQYVSGYTWPELIANQENKLGGLSVRRTYDSWMPSSFDNSSLRHDNGSRAQVWSFKLGTSETVSQIQSLLESVPDKSQVYVIPFHEPVDNMSSGAYHEIYDKVYQAYNNVPGFAGIGSCLTNYSIEHRSALDYVQPEKSTFLSVDYYPEMEGTLGIEPSVAMSRAIDYANTYGLEFQLGEFAVDRSNTVDRDPQLRFLSELRYLWQSVDKLGPLTYFDIDMDGFDWRIETDDILTAYQSLRDHYQSGV